MSQDCSHRPRGFFAGSRTQWVPPVAVFVLLVLALAHAGAAERPNILWITSEDNSPYLGCYGGPQAHTPHLDQLATEGVRYRYAFANAPVCSTARTTLITGMQACSLGAQHHRSRVRIPAAFPLYPEVLRQGGYYCTNNSKTDYNLADRPSPWDESGRQAHYRRRAAGQPFFAVFNFTTSHESQVAPKPEKGDASFRIPPSEIRLPPYHPDTPEIRRDWANYYDQMSQMDAQVGQVLKELEEQGLADDTIVFYYSDHGGALPGGKRNIHDVGTRVPLIVRFPQRWRDWSPAPAGGWCDDLVSFVDFPPTALSLADLPIPANYQGIPFLGPQKGPPREHVFLFRGRMDERYDTVRAVRDRRYRYVRNYNAELPWGQPYSYPFQVQPSMRSWHAEYLAGRCNDAQRRYWEPKPSEELYDLETDPFELSYLAADPAHAARLQAFRVGLDADMLAIRDTGLIPEGMFETLAGNGGLHDFANSDAYPLAQLLSLSQRAITGGPADLPLLLEATESDQPLIRFWGAVGWQRHSRNSRETALQGTKLLQDPQAEIRVLAAETLFAHSDAERCLHALSQVIDAGSKYEQLAALNALDRLASSGAQLRQDQVLALLPDREFPEPADRIVKRLQRASGRD